MKRAVYILYLFVVLALVFALGSTDEDRSDWDGSTGSGASGWHFSGGHK